MPKPEPDQAYLLEAEAIRRRIFRAMTPAQRLDVSMDIYWATRERIISAIRNQNPGWTEEQVRQAVREELLYVER